MAATLIQLAILAVIFVVVYAALRDHLPQACIAAILVAGVMAFGWIRRHLTE